LQPAHPDNQSGSQPQVAQDSGPALATQRVDNPIADEKRETINRQNLDQTLGPQRAGGADGIFHLGQSALQVLDALIDAPARRQVGPKTPHFICYQHRQPTRQFPLIAFA
jgi:hypothetical protein